MSTPTPWERAAYLKRSAANAAPAGADEEDIALTARMSARTASFPTSATRN
jgi:hypothetical protein